MKTRTARLVAAMLLGLMATACASVPARSDAMPEPDRTNAFPGPRPFIVAHRGGAGLYPENTLPAISHALDLGVDGIEIDVHLSADGDVIVYHDFTLKPDITREPDGQWITEQVPLNMLTTEQLQAYDVGRAKPGSAFEKSHPDMTPVDGTPMPTLPQVIELMQSKGDPATRLWVEIKSAPQMPDLSSPTAMLAEAVVTDLREAGFMARADILSFDWRVLREVHALAPELPLVYVTYDVRKAMAKGHARDRHAQADMVMKAYTGGLDMEDFGGSIPAAILTETAPSAWSSNFTDVDAEDIKIARSGGLLINTWTVDDPRTAEVLVNFGVQSITTDRPDLMLEHFSASRPE